MYVLDESDCAIVCAELTNNEDRTAWGRGQLGDGTGSLLHIAAVTNRHVSLRILLSQSYEVNFPSVPSGPRVIKTGDLSPGFH
jgi:hypothetical protein